MKPLDDAYANAAHIPGAEDYPPRWAQLAAEFRKTLEGEGRARLGLSYGDTARQVMDIFLPDGRAKGLCVFVHGGYWLRFDNSYWSHFASGPLERGWAVAMPSYDLCPGVTIAQITEQIAKAVGFAAQKVEGPIALTGHSAGGHLVARMAVPGVLPDDLAARLSSIVPISPVADLRPPEALRQMFPEHLARRVCRAERGKAHQLGLQRALLLGRGTLDPGAPMPEESLGAPVKDLVMHEVGHTLGLRHNFKASSGIPTDRLHDESYTEEHGVSLSVMDYAPVNVALQKDEQGHYWNPNVGTYDEWAIRYGYQPIAEQSGDGSFVRDAPLADTTTAAAPGLDKIAAQSSDPMHRYGTDEDAALGAYAVDPLTNTWELGSDPLAFADTRTALVRDVEPKLDDRLIGDGDRYHALREATTALLSERYRALQPVVKTVGGSYVSRDHKGTPDARPPFRPVAPDTQRQAVEVLVDNAFAPEAFQFEPERLNKLAPDRHNHWGTSGEMPLDYPVHRIVGTLQTGLLEDLVHPARLQRMIDTQVRTDEGEGYGPGELLQRLSDAIWMELGPAGRDPQSINSFRRPLQRTYTDRLVQLMMNTTSWITISTGGIDQIDTPEDIRSLARLELQDLSTALGRALADPGLDRATEAHLTETKERIDRALEASMAVSP